MFESFAALLLLFANQDRAAAGVPPLTLAVEARSVAVERANAQMPLVAPSHYSACGIAALCELWSAGIVSSAVGENLAIAEAPASDDLARQVETALMASPEHRANLLAPEFQRVAIGVDSNSARTTVAEIFLGQ